MAHGVALHHQPAPATQRVLPELGVQAFGVVAGVDRVHPSSVVGSVGLGQQRRVGLGGVAEVAELFVVAQAAVGAFNA